MVVPPIVVSVAPDCWFYRSGANALETGIPPGAKLFDGTGQRLEVVGSDLCVVHDDPVGDDELAAILASWMGYMDAIRGSLEGVPLHTLLRCAVEHSDWSDRASVQRRYLHHWLIFLPRQLAAQARRDPREFVRSGTYLVRYGVGRLAGRRGR